jgi:hypothetical protein
LPSCPFAISPLFHFALFPFWPIATSPNIPISPHFHFALFLIRPSLIRPFPFRPLPFGPIPISSYCHLAPFLIRPFTNVLYICHCPRQNHKLQDVYTSYW